MVLSKRLETVVSFVDKGLVAADVGTDHGYVPIALVERGISPFAIAMDIKPGPLERAGENISQHKVAGKISVRLSDGLNALADKEADCVIISGMGGALILRILQDAGSLLYTMKTLVLSPQSEAEKVRGWLYERGFGFLDEEMVEEEGIYYPIMKIAVPTASDRIKPRYSADVRLVSMISGSGSRTHLSEAERYYGPCLLRKRSPVLYRYLNREKRIALRVLGQLKEAAGTRGETRKAQVKDDLERIECALAYYTGEQSKGRNYGMEGNSKMIVFDVRGEVQRLPAPVTFADAACRFRDRYPDEIILALENGRLRELHNEISDGAHVDFLTMESRDGFTSWRRSLLMLMLRAFWEITGGKKGYAIRTEFVVSQGLYCVMENNELLTDELLNAVQARMHELCEHNLPIRKISVPTREAVAMFHERGMEDKVQLLRYRMSSRTNLYEIDGYSDYFYGYMAHSTGCLNNFELVRYEKGFVLRYPRERTDGPLPSFAPNVKLFKEQEKAEAWGDLQHIMYVGELNERIVGGKADDLILTQEAYHEMQVAKIASEIASHPERKIVLIAGPSSSGKTTFSHRLSTQLATYGLKPHPIPVDDYFVDRENTPLNEDGSYNFECLEAIDIEQFNEDMLALLAGEEVELPLFNFRTGKREYKGKKLKLEPEDILVIEGIHGLNDKLTYALPSEAKYRIYISALTQLSADMHNRISTNDGRLIRRIVRDARTRGTSAEDTIAMWPSVRRGEESHIFTNQENADVMFNSALIYELSVLKIYVEPLLYGIPEDSPSYLQANRLLKFLDYFVPIPPEAIPSNSLLREFIGGSCYDV